MSRSSMGAGRTTVARRAFTLIEVLVVVAIIALLISILLPSLRQARDVSKMMVCQSHLKEVGNAMAMYISDFKEALPGPLHPLFLKYPERMSSTSKFVVEGYLNTRLRKYFGESTFKTNTSASYRKSTTREIGTCPSFPVSDESFGGNVYNFALNNSAITAPNFYFGFTHGGITSYEQWLDKYGSKSRKWWPKRMSRIFYGGVSPSREWLLADAFRRPHPENSTWGTAAEPGHEIFPTLDNADSTRQNEEWGSLSPSVQVPTNQDASGKYAPSSPFHPNLSSCGFRKVNLGGGTVTRFFGKVNTLYFDGHAEAQNGWRGTTVEAFDTARNGHRLDK